MYKAIISDIDGTLTPIGPNHLPTEKVTEAIQKAMEKGVAFTLASGRPLYMLEYLVKHLNLASPLIIDNGAVIVDAKTGSVLWEKVLPTDEARVITSLINRSYFMRVSCDDVVLDNPVLIPDQVKVRKVSVHDITNEDADILIKKIEDRFKNLAIVKASSYKSKDLTDIYFSHAEATKQHAVLHFAKLMGITPAEIIGIGDGYNDFSLLMACGLKVAMGNAVPELKTIADYVCPSVAEDGIVDVLNKYFI